MKREVALSPAMQLARRNTTIGIFLLAMGATAFAALPMVLAWPIAVFGALMGAILVWGGYITRTSARGSEAVNKAWDATSRGHLAEAQRVLDEMSSGRQLSYLQRTADFCAARIAFRRGDLPTALARANAVVDRPIALVGRGYAKTHQINGRALRALIHAALGNREAARADAAAVRQSPIAHPDAIARAELAEAIVLEKAGDRDALAAHLTRHAALLGEGTTPRERAIVRAYERLVRGRNASVYRTGASRDDALSDASEPALEDWMARVAPAAAPFARRARLRRADEPERASAAAPRLEVDAALERVAAKDFTERMSRNDKTGRRGARLVALWAALVVFMVGAYSFFDAVETTHRPRGRHATAVGSEVAALLPVVFLFVFGASFAIFIWRRVRSAKREGLALNTASRLASSGETERADHEYEALTKSKIPLYAANAHLALAWSAERRAAFAEGLAACDRGLEAVAANAQTRVLASSTMTPSLLAERALLLALTGEEDKARAQMAHVAATFPTFPLLARAERRFDLILRARRGDFEGAARIAGDDACDAALPSRDEMLGELARAVAAPESMSREEVGRLRERLTEAPVTRTWIEAVAPELLTAFEAGRRRVDPYGTTEPNAEVEARAEEEAALALAQTVARAT